MHTGFRLPVAVSMSVQSESKVSVKYLLVTIPEYTLQTKLIEKVSSRFVQDTKSRTYSADLRSLLVLYTITKKLQSILLGIFDSATL